MSSVTSAPRVLILAFANWFGAPRLPRAFQRAGFHVTTFAFSGLLIQRSQSINESVLLPDSSSNEQLLAALLVAIERSRADIIVPTDDTSIILLHAAAAAARAADVPERTRHTIGASLGDLRHLPTVRSRKLLAALANRLEVRRPGQADVYSEADALAFAAKHGYPIVLKEEDSIAGFGVSICRDEAALQLALRRLAQNPRVLSQGLLAQTFVEGRPAMRVVVAEKGRILGGLSALKLETWPGATGPSSCVELVDHAEMAATAEAIIASLGYSGFASLDFMVDGNGSAHLIELNPRPTPITHLGERVGACLCRKLFASLTGTASVAGEPRGLPLRVALFPQEWVRDQNSPHIQAGVYHDAPWDEPDLVEAYVTMGRAQMRWAGYRALDIRNEDLRQRLAQLEQEA